MRRLSHTQSWHAHSCVVADFRDARVQVFSRWTGSGQSACHARPSLRPTVACSRSRCQALAAQPPRSRLAAVAVSARLQPHQAQNSPAAAPLPPDRCLTLAQGDVLQLSLHAEPLPKDCRDEQAAQVDSPPAPHTGLSPVVASLRVLLAAAHQDSVFGRPLKRLTMPTCRM